MLRSIKRQGDAIALLWQDETAGVLEPRALRLHCPCAHCVSEVSGEILLDAATVPEDLTILDMQPVGNYAYRILFSDHHDSGIYQLELLRDLCKESSR